MNFQIDSKLSKSYQQLKSKRVNSEFNQILYNYNLVQKSNFYQKQSLETSYSNNTIHVQNGIPTLDIGVTYYQKPEIKRKIRKIRKNISMAQLEESTSFSLSDDDPISQKEIKFSQLSLHLDDLCEDKNIQQRRFRK